MKASFNEKAQVTIFIVIAIMIVALTIGFFMFREAVIPEGISSSLEPVYNTFLSCLEEEMNGGIDLLETQGGYIEIPEFEAGSEYMPFSSQLNFLGNPIPYWYYVSGNNLPKEQVPSISQMETQLADFVEERINLCNYDLYYDQGFLIDYGSPFAKVDIRDEEVILDLDLDFNIQREEDNALVNSHLITVNSKLGKLYNSAREVYEQEQETLFLENYGIDVLRTYAPVDGVELTCSPLIWNAEEIFDNLQEGIVSNTLFLKSQEGDYVLQDRKDRYFVTSVDVGSEVQFLTSKDWPYTLEVSPSDDVLMMASPVGNQQGLGILGFCYVPYHFVYDMKYPILVQVIEGDEIFQFPMAVVIEGNNPREALNSVAVSAELPEICEYKNVETQVNVFDTGLNSLDAEISYECFGTSCYIGETISGSLIEDFPQCVNGNVLVRAEGYNDVKYLYSTNEEGKVDVILDKKYPLELEVLLDGNVFNGEVIVSFVSEKLSQTLVYPSQKEIELIEGQYEIDVAVYRNSSLKIDETTQEQCMEVPESGFGGLLGLTEEKCFDITIPSQIISNALAGGGKQNYYVLESELSGSDKIELGISSLPIPQTLEQLQDNYLLVETKNVGVIFK